MGKKLIIVESPSKCKTIGKYLGDLYIVKPSVGHIREIPTDKNAINMETFEVNYIVSENKKDVVADLKKAVKEAEFVYLASDFDREGEQIAFSLEEVLKMPKSKYKRITFTEITKKALEDAIKNPRDIDMNLVNAQKTRAICDRIAGFGMSGLLNFKVQRGTSAGRVQSIGLLLICNNWKNYQQFYKGSTASDYKIIGLFEVKDDKNKIHTLKAILNKRFKNKIEANVFLEKCINKKFFIKNIETSEGVKKSPPPYNTSSMQIDAIRKLGMTAERVANAAQGIYQNGHTTYIRTDSISMSDDALNASEKQIKEEFGSKYSQRKQHQSKGKNTQESHECIRPTDFSKHEIEGTSDEKRLYELIWKRAMASQMSNCVVDKTLITIVADGLKEEFQTRGEIIKFDGYKKLYTEENFDENKEEDDDKTILPTVKNGQPINTIQIDGMEIFQRPKALFTEATLLKELETIGVGRPSTIATIKKTLTTRLYIDKKDLPAKKRDVCNVQLKNNTIEEEIRTENFGKEVGKLIPTDLGIIVCDFLLKNFPDLMNQNYTSELEDLLDLIASGKEDFKKVLTEFNNVFQQNLKNAKGNTEKIGVRLLGNDPKSGKPIYAKLGRFGPMIQLGESVKQDKSNKDKKEKSDVKFTKIPDDESIESITLENALKLLAWPRLLGEHKGKEVTCAIGRFGPYVKYNDKFYSIKEQDPNTITLKESLEIIKTLDEAKKENGTANNGKIKEFKKEEIVVLNGKFGAYIKYKNKNYKISDEYDASKITKEECFDIIKSKFKKK